MEQKSIDELWEQLPDFVRNPNPNVYRSNNYVYVDFETSNIDKGSPYNQENRTVLAVWICGTDHPNNSGSRPELHYRWGNEFELGRLVEDIERADYFVAHNSKFEYGWLKRCGLDISKTLAYCTQIGEYCIAGNRPWRFSLDASLDRWGMNGKESHVSKLMKLGICPSEMPKKWLLKYGKMDVLQGHELFVSQRQKIYKEGLHKTFLTHNLFTPVLTDIEPRGMHLDEDRVKAVHQKFAMRLRELEVRLNKITGGINTRSGKQLANFLFKEMKFKIPKDHRGKDLVNKPTDDWPDGCPKTDKDTLLRLVGKNKKQREFLEIVTEYNNIKSTMSKTLDKFHSCVTEMEDNILLAKFNQTRTQTHRLSSSGLHYKVQLQNQDNRFKPIFSPRNEGWFIGEADEAQLEYRVAVYLGQDEAGKSDIENKVDAHGFTASIIFKEEWEACGGDKSTPEGKECRRLSKAHTFLPLYGGSSGTERQREYYQAFKDKHRGILSAQEEWIDTVYRQRELTVETGMKFYWESAKMNRWGKLIRPDGRPVDQSVCNTPVQYLATAEIVPISAIYTWHLMRVAEMESFLINTVHDSVIGEIHPDERDLFREITTYCMEEVPVIYLKQVYGMEFNILLEAEVDFSSHWSTSTYWEEEYLGETPQAA